MKRTEEAGIKKKAVLLGFLALIGAGMVIGYTMVSDGGDSKDDAAEYDQGTAIIVSGTGSNATGGISNETNAQMLSNANSMNMKIRQKGQVTNDINLSVNQQDAQQSVSMQ